MILCWTGLHRQHGRSNFIWQTSFSIYMWSWWRVVSIEEEAHCHWISRNHRVCSCYWWAKSCMIYWWLKVFFLIYVIQMKLYYQYKRLISSYEAVLFHCSTFLIDGCDKKKKIKLRIILLLSKWFNYFVNWYASVNLIWVNLKSLKFYFSKRKKKS